MKDLKALEEKYAALGEEIAKLKAAPKEWPQAGDEMWGLFGTGQIIPVSYFNLAHKNYLDQGNLFRTEAEALAERDARAVVAELRRQPGRKMFIEEEGNDGFVVDLVSGSVSIHNWYADSNGWHSIYFESEQAARDAIKAVGKERILKAARWWAMGEV